MAPTAHRAFPPVEAGALLTIVTALAIGFATVVGWAAGSLKVGLIVGCVVGLPVGIVTIYRRYRDTLS